MKNTLKQFTIIFISIFIIVILFGIFISGNINIFEWKESGRVGVVLVTSIVSLILIMFKSLEKYE